MQLTAGIAQFASTIGDHPMDVVVAIEQKLGEIRSILTRESGDQSDAIHNDSCFVGQPIPAKMTQQERGGDRWPPWGKNRV